MGNQSRTNGLSRLVWWWKERERNETKRDPIFPQPLSTIGGRPEKEVWRAQQYHGSGGQPPGAAFVPTHTIAKKTTHYVVETRLQINLHGRRTGYERFWFGVWNRNPLLRECAVPTMPHGCHLLRFASVRSSGCPTKFDSCVLLYSTLPTTASNNEQCTEFLGRLFYCIALYCTALGRFVAIHPLPRSASCRCERGLPAIAVVPYELLRATTNSPQGPRAVYSAVCCILFYCILFYCILFYYILLHCTVLHSTGWLSSIRWRDGEVTGANATFSGASGRSDAGKQTKRASRTRRDCYCRSNAPAQGWTV